MFALIALESLGIPLPGETALIAASIYAGSTHHLDIFAIAAVASAAAIIGDNGGYWLGRRGGGALVARYGHIVRLDRRKLKVGRYLFARHGGSVVFFGRFISVLRTYAAFLAGLNRMPLARFAAANAAGGVVWAAATPPLAYAIGSAAASLGSLVTLVGLGSRPCSRSSARSCCAGTWRGSSGAPRRCSPRPRPPKRSQLLSLA